MPDCIAGAATCNDLIFEPPTNRSLAEAYLTSTTSLPGGPNVYSAETNDINNQDKQAIYCIELHFCIMSQ